MSNSKPSKPGLLGQPLTLPNGTVLKNRLAKAAMSETMGTWRNQPTDQFATLYKRWAASGLGLILTGNIMIDRRALGEPGNVAVEDDADMAVLRQWSGAVTAQGGAIWAQINHPGKQATKGLNAETIAPSAVPFRKDMQALFATPREMTPAEIEDAIRRFGNTAAICKRAGFSGVQIHAAHGYLVNQFLSPQQNLRIDEWGGDAERRQRFVLAVYAEIRQQVGPDFPVGIKLNSADFQHGGLTEEESLDTIRALAAAGIDLIEISGGTYEAPAMSGAMEEPRKASTRTREAYFLDFAAKARAVAPTVPLMVTGGFRTAAGMNAALASGALDVVGLARLLAIDPEAPVALLAGRDSQEQVRPIRTGIAPIDKMGVMEVFWYEAQLKRIAKGGDPRPHESAFFAFIKAFLSSQWGALRTRRVRS